MAGIDCAQHIRAGHAHLGREFLDARRADHRPERKLQVDVYSSADACALAARGMGVSIVEPFTALYQDRPGLS
jgi:DNA-binding transcriptional LysR family regulator